MGWGRQGNGISISTMQKGAILRKCANTFVPHCRRRSFHELNSPSLVGLMKSSTFGVGIFVERDNRLFLLMASKIQWNLLSLREVVILH